MIRSQAAATHWMMLMLAGFLVGGPKATAGETTECFARHLSAAMEMIGRGVWRRRRPAEPPPLIPNETEALSLNLRSLKKAGTWVPLMANDRTRYFVEDLSGRILMTDQPLGHPESPLFVVKDQNRNDGIDQFVVRRSGKLSYDGKKRKFTFEENPAAPLDDAERDALRDRLSQRFPEAAGASERKALAGTEERILRCEEVLKHQTGDHSFILTKVGMDLAFRTEFNLAAGRFHEDRGFWLAMADYGWVPVHDGLTLGLSTLLAKSMPMVPLAGIFYAESMAEPYLRRPWNHYVFGKYDDADPKTGKLLSEKIASGDLLFSTLAFPAGFGFNMWMLRRFPSYMMAMCQRNPKALLVFNPFVMRFMEKQFWNGVYTGYQQLKYGNELKDKP